MCGTIKSPSDDNRHDGGSLQTSEPEYLTFDDDEGNEEQFELLGTMEYDARTFVVLGPVESFDGEFHNEIAILEQSADDNDDLSYLEIEDESLLDMLFNAFMGEEAEPE